MIKTLILLLTICSFCSLSAQNLKIKIVPEHAIIRLNDEVIELEVTKGIYETTLPEGVYNIEIWAPNMELYEELISIKEGETTNFSHALNKVNDEYLESLRAKKKHSLRKFLWTTTDVSVVALNAGLITNLLIPSADLKYVDKIELAASNYETSVIPEDIATYAQQYENFVTKYDNRSKNKLRIELPVTMATAGLSIYYFIRRTKNKPQEPAPFIEKNPFLNGTVGIHVPQGNNGFTLNLKKTF